MYDKYRAYEFCIIAYVYCRTYNMYVLYCIYRIGGKFEYKLYIMQGSLVGIYWY